MAREQEDTEEIRTVPCGECGTDTVPATETADKSLFPDCIQTLSKELREEDDHVVICREWCGKPTEISERFDSAMCADCHRDAGRFSDVTPPV